MRRQSYPASSAPLPRGRAEGLQEDGGGTWRQVGAGCGDGGGRGEDGRGGEGARACAPPAPPLRRRPGERRRRRPFPPAVRPCCYLPQPADGDRRIQPPLRTAAEQRPGPAAAVTRGPGAGPGRAGVSMAIASRPGGTITIPRGGLAPPCPAPPPPFSLPCPVGVPAAEGRGEPSVSSLFPSSGGGTALGFGP